MARPTSFKAFLVIADGIAFLSFQCRFQTRNMQGRFCGK